MRLLLPDMSGLVMTTLNCHFEGESPKQSQTMKRIASLHFIPLAMTKCLVLSLRGRKPEAI
jgi:hypothetical protein